MGRTLNATADTMNNSEDVGADTTINTAKSLGNTPQASTSSSTSKHTPPTNGENTTTSIKTIPDTEYSPHKKFEVIFEAVEGFSIEQYLRTIADDIGGSNIKYASRLSGGRICVHLAAESFVSQICASGCININNTFIQCRSYVMASKRVVLSNVLPGIPSETLIPSLRAFRKITYNITQLPISTVY
jgi:hypothetical protein